jgi:hypothetical protein
VRRRLEWHETASGLLYQAAGDSDRRYIIAVAGQTWTLDLLVDGQYESTPAVDPAPVATLELAQQMAQE